MPKTPREELKATPDSELYEAFCQAYPRDFADISLIDGHLVLPDWMVLLSPFNDFSALSMLNWKLVIVGEQRHYHFQLSDENTKIGLGAYVFILYARVKHQEELEMAANDLLKSHTGLVEDDIADSISAFNRAYLDEADTLDGLSKTVDIALAVLRKLQSILYAKLLLAAQEEDRAALLMWSRIKAETVEPLIVAAAAKYGKMEKIFFNSMVLLAELNIHMWLYTVLSEPDKESAAFATMKKETNKLHVLKASLPDQQSPCYDRVISFADFLPVFNAWCPFSADLATVSELAHMPESVLKSVMALTTRKLAFVSTGLRQNTQPYLEYQIYDRLMQALLVFFEKADGRALRDFFGFVTKDRSLSEVVDHFIQVFYCTCQHEVEQQFYAQLLLTAMYVLGPNGAGYRLTDKARRFKQTAMPEDKHKTLMVQFKRASGILLDDCREWAVEKQQALFRYDTADVKLNVLQIALFRLDPLGFAHLIDFLLALNTEDLIPALLSDTLVITAEGVKRLNESDALRIFHKKVCIGDLKKFNNTIELINYLLINVADCDAYDNVVILLIKLLALGQYSIFFNCLKQFGVHIISRLLNFFLQKYNDVNFFEEIERRFLKGMLTFCFPKKLSAKVVADRLVKFHDKAISTVEKCVDLGFVAYLPDLFLGAGKQQNIILDALAKAEKTADGLAALAKIFEVEQFELYERKICFTLLTFAKDNTLSKNIWLAFARKLVRTYGVVKCVNNAFFRAAMPDLIPVEKQAVEVAPVVVEASAAAADVVEETVMQPEKDFWRYYNQHTAPKLSEKIAALATLASRCDVKFSAAEKPLLIVKLHTLQALYQATQARFVELEARWRLQKEQANAGKKKSLEKLKGTEDLYWSLCNWMKSNRPNQREDYQLRPEMTELIDKLGLKKGLERCFGQTCSQVERLLAPPKLKKLPAKKDNRKQAKKNRKQPKPVEQPVPVAALSPAVAIPAPKQDSYSSMLQVMHQEPKEPKPELPWVKTYGATNYWNDFTSEHENAAKAIPPGGGTPPGYFGVHRLMKTRSLTPAITAVGNPPNDRSSHSP